MKYAIIDTETSGLFRFKDAAGVPVPADDPSQPRLAHLGVILVDEQLQEERSIDLYVRPDGWKMEPEAFAVNGLTDEFLAENGADVRDVLDQYVRVIDAGYVIVAFNAQFDCKQMRGELRRAGMDDRFEQTPNICVMRTSMALKIKKASGGGGFPKLADVCAHFGIDHKAVHTAGGDARAALEIFRRLHAAGMLPTARVHYAKTPPLHAVEPPAGLSGKGATVAVVDEFVSSRSERF
ncbi:3'-5' exonuclease [Aminobacter aminovorans]|uniref:DNA polymerase-3 subunit epsilon n=1 Tax=Aminobacter aminovorans TaxID=83263 RepID=A0AAC8YND3_AMIAI|nr:3'-5' exonuclease [Aminobacter aminovorans]AMS41214.1 Exonuclease RNase T and DNA polymerase III [Aminobacter aminovorans]MBB3705803.1 DNA polymerase-3 subunit epsilon [Aminobacter aminovorans]